MEDLVEQLLSEIRKSGKTYRQVSLEVSTHHSLISDWQQLKHSPSLRKFQLAADAVGFRLRLEKK